MIIVVPSKILSWVSFVRSIVRSIDRSVPAMGGVVYCCGDDFLASVM